VKAARLVWRLLWAVPTYTARFLFVALVFIGWGRRAALYMWEDTK
jgi:hypothetical protein